MTKKPKDSPDHKQGLNRSETDVTKIDVTKADVTKNNVTKNDVQDIEKLYQAYSNEQPDTAIDKQILSASYRELQKPAPIVLTKKIWWKRLVFPMITASTLIFSLMAANWIFQVPVTVPPGTSSSLSQLDTTKIDLENYFESKELNKKRKRQALPEKPSVPDIYVPRVNAEQTLTTIDESNLRESFSFDADLENIQNENIQNKNGQIMEQPSDSCVVTIRGKEIHCNDYNKEKWLIGIKKLFQTDKKAAQQELLKFNKTYPNYLTEKDKQYFKF